MTSKISQLPAAAAPLTGDEMVELSQLSGGSYASVSASAEQLSYANARLGSFYDLTDQTGNIAAATAVLLGSAWMNTAGITIASGSRVTYADAGTYMISPSLQFGNSDAADQDVTVWFAKNGTAITASATRVTVPKAGDGGAAFFTSLFYETLAAGDYLQVMWLPENAAVTIEHTAAGAIAPAVPSAILVTERIAL